MADGDESASSEAVNANLGVPARNDNSRADDAREGVEQRQNEGRVQHPNTQSSSIPPSVALNIPDSSGLEDSTQYPRAHSSTPSGQPGATTGNARSSSGVVDSVQQGSSISSDGASPVTAAAGVPSNDRIRARVAANPSLSSYPSATGNATTAPRTAPVMGTGDDEGSSTSSQASPDVTASRPRVGGGLVPVGDRDFDENTTENELELSVPSHQEHLTSDGQRYTTYEIVVRTGGRKWSVRKRYSQFDAFRHSLRKQHKEVGNFRFPNKSKFNTFSEHTKERRRTGFDEFLRLVAGLHPRPQEVDVFLAMDEHGAGVRGRTASRPPAWTSTSVSPDPPRTGSPALGPMWPESVGAGEDKRLVVATRRFSNRGTVQRVPRFPPLADQGRTEKAAEAAAAAAAAAMATAPSRGGPSGFVREVDSLLKRLLGPYLLSMLCVVAVSAACIVVVWKVGGQPGLATLVIAVSVGLFIQNWDRGVDILTLALDSVGLSQSEVREAPPPLPSAARGTSRTTPVVRRSQGGSMPAARPFPPHSAVRDGP